MYSLRTSSASGALPARPCELERAARALWPDAGPPRRLFAWSPASVDQHCHRAATAASGSGCAGSRDDSSLQLVSLSALGLGLRRPSSVCRLGAPALRRPRRDATACVVAARRPQPLPRGLGGSGLRRAPRGRVHVPVRARERAGDGARERRPLELTVTLTGRGTIGTCESRDKGTLTFPPKVLPHTMSDVRKNSLRTAVHPADHLESLLFRAHCY
eukprot:COSAG02_NODE_199_length_29529_cov_32.558289_10_plen_216_part_00